MQHRNALLQYCHIKQIRIRVLTVSRGVLSTYSGFLPESKNIHVETNWQLVTEKCSAVVMVFGVKH